VHTAEVRVHYAALLVSLIRAGMVDAAGELREWAEEYLFYDEDQSDELEELLDVEDSQMP